VSDGGHGLKESQEASWLSFWKYFATEVTESTEKNLLKSVESITGKER
jgi:hypothetical protein